MEMKKCIQCGGNLERQPMKKAWLCPFCGAEYEDEAQEKTAAPEEYYGLNEEVFLAERDLSKIMKERNGAGVINSMAHCMRTYEKACQEADLSMKALEALPWDTTFFREFTQSILKRMQ